ncbi:MAG: sodium-dependent bicarbonate transport family permease [Ilumatobacteraceae bacterium]
MKNLTDPAILFFFLGVFIGLIRSNLQIPDQIAKFLSLYLLMALGFKGGQALGDAGLGGDGAKVIGAALLLAVLTPLLGFVVLRNRVNPFDAAAIAATYGSVSAVTFATASNFLAGQGEAAGGYLTVALVVMESPAIVMAVLLATWVRTKQHAVPESESPVSSVGAAITARDVRSIVPEADHAAGQLPADEGGHHGKEPLSVKEVLREAFTDGAHLLLIGSMVIGLISGADGGKVMKPFVGDLFKGLLAFFLLEMGLLVARQLREVRDVGPFLAAFGLVIPFVNAGIAMLLGAALGLSVGDLTLLAVLAASGSYIVVPAVVRYAIPEARPSRYFTLALGITFPLNVTIGIPIYYAVAKAIAG